MRYLLLLLLTASCATSPAPRAHRPAYYCDGLEVSCPPEAFAHPGYTPRGTGLPEYRPTAEEPEVERSPHKRLLPQTPETRREAGIWAADRPPRSLPPRKVTFYTSDYEYPMPDDAGPLRGIAPI